MITRDSFFAAFSIAPQIETVSTAAGQVHVRAMTAGERDRFDLAHHKDPGRDFRARLLTHSLCDESGRLLLSEADVPQLTALPALMIEPLVEAAIRVNRMSAEDLDALRKNSSGPSGDSSSASA